MVLNFFAQQQKSMHSRICKPGPTGLRPKKKIPEHSKLDSFCVQLLLIIVPDPEAKMAHETHLSRDEKSCSRTSFTLSKSMS